MISPPERRIFCNRTLNFNSIKAVGYDLDYTLVHYNVEVWEQLAFSFAKDGLLGQGWPVGDLTLDLSSVCRGLVIDLALGNLLKVNRFGYVKAAQHGRRRLDFSEMKSAYLKTLVDLSQDRYILIETLFGISEACAFFQLVDLFDENKLCDTGARTYADIHAALRKSLDRAHMDGLMKAEIMADPGKFVQLDPDVTRALQDQRAAGKKVMLITNSEWEYANAMLTHALNPYMPAGETWRDLFDLTVVEAHKPDFFTSRAPIYELVSEDGLFRPVKGPLKQGGVYVGGNVAVVEAFLCVSGDSVLYVGDHIFSDVIISKTSQEWRTAMIVREIEDEVKIEAETHHLQVQLAAKMKEKEALESERAQCKVLLQRLSKGYGDRQGAKIGELRRRIEEIRDQLDSMDSDIAPLAIQAGRGVNEAWGFLMRTGNDKSLLTRQVEKYADIYTSRVSNFYYATPFIYLRSPRAVLAHDVDYASTLL